MLLVMLAFFLPVLFFILVLHMRSHYAPEFSMFPAHGGKPLHLIRQGLQARVGRAGDEITIHKNLKRHLRRVLVQNRRIGHVIVFALRLYQQQGCSLRQVAIEQLV